MRYKNKINDKIWHHPAVNLNGQAALWESFIKAWGQKWTRSTGFNKEKGRSAYILFNGILQYPN